METRKFNAIAMQALQVSHVVESFKLNDGRIVFNDEFGAASIILNDNGTWTGFIAADPRLGDDLFPRYATAIRERDVARTYAFDYLLRHSPSIESPENKRVMFSSHKLGESVYVNLGGYSITINSNGQWNASIFGGSND
jgi:hypothetical protein